MNVNDVLGAFRVIVDQFGLMPIFFAGAVLVLGRYLFSKFYESVSMSESEIAEIEAEFQRSKRKNEWVSLMHVETWEGHDKQKIADWLETDDSELVLGDDGEFLGWREKPKRGGNEG